MADTTFDRDVCPLCKSTKYQNRNLSFLVNICGHAICERCVENLFVWGSAGCPVCKKPLKRSNFRQQYFEDASMDREMQIRRKLSKEFTLHEEDFSSLREYNDYLEMIETYVFQQMENSDSTAIIEKMKKFKERNKEALARKKHVASNYLKELEQNIESERDEYETRQKEIATQNAIQTKERIRLNEAMLDDLKETSLPARTVVEVHEKLIEKTEAKPKVKLLQAKPKIVEFDEKYVYNQCRNFMPMVRFAPTGCSYITLVISNIWGLRIQKNWRVVFSPSTRVLEH